MNNISVYQKTGEYHLLNDMQSQDTVLQEESKTAKISVIADGVSSCENSKRGAEIACEAVSRLMLNETEYLFAASKKKIADLISAYVYKKLLEEARAHNNSVDSYASTLSFVCYNKLSGEVMTFVLGDSLVYIIDQGAIALSCTPSVIYEHMTYTTTTKNVADIIKVDFSKKNDVKFLLATDGAWKTFYYGGGGSFSRELLKAVEEDNIDSYLENQHCVDDCSIVTIAIPKGA